MNDFENKIVGLTYCSRYIASWTKVHTRMKRPVYFGETFMKWLTTECGLSEEDARFVRNFAENGKLEFETNAMMFIEAND